MRISYLLGGAPLVAIMVSQALSACGGGSGAAAGDGGADVGPSYDGGGADVGPTYYGDDGGFPEGSSTTDAANDSTLPDAGVGTSFCSTLSPRPTLCSDFDEGPGSLAPWTINTLNGNGVPGAGTVTLDLSTFVSSPGSLHQATNPALGDAGDFYRALISKHFGVTGSDVTFASDVLRPDGGSTVVAELAFGHPDGTSDVLDVLLGGGAYQYVPGDAGGIVEVKYFNIGAGMPAGAWHRFTLHVVVGPPATMSVTFDTTTVLDAGVLDPRFANGAVSATIGPIAHSPAPAQDLHLDDVVIDIKP